MSNKLPLMPDTLQREAYQIWPNYADIKIFSVDKLGISVLLNDSECQFQAHYTTQHQCYTKFDVSDLYLSLGDFSKRIIHPVIVQLVNKIGAIHPLRDLAAQIKHLAENHRAYGQGVLAINACIDHLSAIARNHEANAQITALSKNG